MQVHPGAYVLVVCSTVLAQPAGEPAKAPVPSAPAVAPAAPAATSVPAGPAEAKKLTADERLASAAKLYAEAKSYRDEGAVVTEAASLGQKEPLTATFTTAFERGGRFRWAYTRSARPGPGPDERCTIWSDDGKSFSASVAQVDKQREGQKFDMALIGAAGFSNRVVLMIVPMLHVAGKPGPWVGQTTDLVGAEEKGKETVDGVECWKIMGKKKAGTSKVTLWIDNAGLIRKLVDETEFTITRTGGGGPQATPSAAETKYTSVTTITIKPFVNEPKIDDAKFAADPKDGGQPAK